MSLSSAFQFFGVTLTTVFILNQAKKMSTGARNLISGTPSSNASIVEKGDVLETPKGGMVISILA